MSSPHDDLPSDCEPSPTVRHLHCDLRQRIERFQDAKVVDLDVMRRRRDLEQRDQRGRMQTEHDLANAFRSADAGRYDPLDDKEPA